MEKGYTVFFSHGSFVCALGCPQATALIAFRSGKQNFLKPYGLHFLCFSLIFFVCLQVAHLQPEQG